MRSKFKKLLLTFIITAVSCILFSLSVFAGNGIEDRINSLKSKYPDGYFWNHKVTTSNNNGDQLMARWDESYSESVTSSPCKTHNGTAAIGQYDCNFFDGGIQCFGFARRVFYDIFGVRASEMPKRYDINNVQVGDCIRINNDGHSAVVIARNGNTLTLVEANLDLSGPSYNCKIRWGATCDISKITYFHHASNYDAVKGDTTPTQPSYFTGLWHGEVSETNARIDATINLTYVQQCGFYYGTSASNMHRVVEDTYANTLNIWFNFNEYGITLSPGSAYYYKIFIVVNGTEYCSDVKSFTTGGTRAEMTYPEITFNKGYYIVGDTVSFSWEKTGSNTDFYQYWVIVTNETTGKQYYAGATGDAGDVGKNTLSFIADKEGKYKITVYAVPYNDKDEREKADVEYINVTKSHTHSYKATVISKATCTKKGSIKYSCSCGYSYMASSEKTAHTYKTVTAKAMLNKNGKTETKCTVCDFVKSSSTIYSPKTFTLSATKYTYNGKVKTPSVTVKDSKGKVLKKDTDYTVKYESGRKLPGKYTVTVTFKGKYSGTKKLNFNIIPEKIKKFTVSQTTDTVTVKWSKITGVDAYRVYKYNSKTKKYDKVTDVKGTSVKIKGLKPGTVYNFKVRGYKKDEETIGGVHSDEIITATKCRKTSIKKITSSGKKINLTWSKISEATGYQVVYSTSKNFTESTTKKVNVKKASTVKATLKSLKKGKKYYVKVRAYKTADGKKIYGAYSAVKNIKVK